MQRRVDPRPVWRILCAFFLTLILVSLLLPQSYISAQAVDDGSVDTDPIIVAYTKQFFVSYAEAERRLLLQADTGKIIDEIARTEPSFAGAWVEHEPTFQLVIAVADDDAVESVKQYAGGLTWRGTINVIKASKTLVDLEAELAALKTLLDRAEYSKDLVNGTGLNIPVGKVRIYTPNAELLRGHLIDDGTLNDTNMSTDDLDFVPQASPSAPAQYKYPYLHGGTALSDCTLGYVVRRLSDNKRFVSTAGHCANSNSVDFAGSAAEDTYLGPVVLENNPFVTPPVGPLGYAADIQVHNSWVRDFDLTNLVWTGTSAPVRVMYSQTKGGTLGWTVCKYGKRTGLTCGQVIDINLAPNGWPSTYVRVRNSLQTGEIACPGDSGGPVFFSAPGGVAAVGTLSTEQDQACGGVSTDFGYAPIDQFLSLGFDVLSWVRPQYYYQNVFWSDTNCIEYSSQLDANGNITTQQSKACPTTPPGSGAVQSYTGYLVADQLREGIWRGNAGYLRAVPLTTEGRINWNAAPAWSQVGGSTPPRAQDDYIIGNNYFQNVFWSETSCIEYRAPLDTNGNLITSQQTQGACQTTAPGTGTIQSYTAWVVNDQLREAMWRNNIGYMRTVPLNAAKTDAQWSSAPAWTQCCTGTAPQAQSVYILNHP